MGKQQDEKTASLRKRIEELKVQLKKTKTQRDNAKNEKERAQGILDKTRGYLEQARQHGAEALAQLEALRSQPPLPAPIVDAPPSLFGDFEAECRLFLGYCQGFGPPSFFSDGLVCWYRNMDSMQSPKFKKAYRRGMSSGHKFGRAIGGDGDLHIEWRISMALWAASHAARLEGDFVECGVNTGIMSLAICDCLGFNSLNKDFYLFDTYQGIPENQMSATERTVRMLENELHYEECFETARRNFAEWPRCRLLRGTIPESLGDTDIWKVAYLHIDLNIAAPELAVLEFFWDKMVAGGVILFDDYGFSNFREQFDSANEFATRKNVSIATLPTGQGLLLKS